ncbi:MAG: cofactor-independent phosphoglycerate mutase [Candidatus Omnitrophica bacterium]|nr:cofactor-independent phosphoglycerate mutase [Candidatus Omnitrophota bacterium]
MKYILIVPDGMADLPLELLAEKTPLEVAKTPNMDYLAQHGRVGRVRTIPKGMSAGSDVANMSLLGYDPKKYLYGRAPLEAANLNIHLHEDEVAFRCNLVTVEDEKMADYSAGHIRNEEAKVLIQELNQKLGSDKIKFYEGKSYRHLLVVKDPDVKRYLDIETTPPHDILGKDIKKYLPKGKFAELILGFMEKSREVLRDHPINQVRIDLKENPANMIWLWSQGQKPQMPLFVEKYNLKGGIISAVDLVNGLGKLIGLEIVKVPGITGYYDTNYLGKAEYALKALKKNDFVYIHIEAPDEAGHNGDIKAKISCIEHIDKDIVGTVLNYFKSHDDIRILVVPDHPTPIKLRTHTDDPVGFIMFGKNIPESGTQEFNEKTAKESDWAFENGESLINFFIKEHL